MGIRHPKKGKRKTEPFPIHAHECLSVRMFICRYFPFCKCLYFFIDFHLCSHADTSNLFPHNFFSLCVLWHRHYPCIREVHDSFLNFQMTIWSSSWWLKKIPYISKDSNLRWFQVCCNTEPPSRYDLCFFWQSGFTKWFHLGAKLGLLRILRWTSLNTKMKCCVFAIVCFALLLCAALLCTCTTSNPTFLKLFHLVVLVSFHIFDSDKVYFFRILSHRESEFVSSSDGFVYTLPVSTCSTGTCLLPVPTPVTIEKEKAKETCSLFHHVAPNITRGLFLLQKQVI